MRSDAASLSDKEYLRYGRQLMLAEVGEEGQARLKDKSVLIVGLGGLGSPLALYLAGAGVGTLWLADGDTVDSSNLPRQILFDSEAVNHSKAELARERLAAHNPLVELIAINQRLDADSLPEFVAEVDLVIDCCDNLATRQAINAACVAQGKPWISAAAVGWQGQLMARTRSGSRLLRLPLSAGYQARPELRDQRRHRPAGRGDGLFAGAGGTETAARDAEPGRRYSAPFRCPEPSVADPHAGSRPRLPGLRAAPMPDTR